MVCCRSLPISIISIDYRQLYNFSKKERVFKHARSACEGTSVFLCVFLFLPRGYKFGE